MIKKSIGVIALALLVIAVATTVAAAPLPNGTTLSVDVGTDSAFNTPCTIGGSCFSMEVSPGFSTWENFGPGTDGGFILGKDQVSGGQELAPSSTNTTPGELSAAWTYFSNYGTFTTTSYPGLGYSVGASDNLFDDAGCTLTGCIGKTELNAWYVCWNDGIYAMGSGYPCAAPACSPEQQSEISIEYYTIDPTTGGDWSIYHKWVVPLDPPSSFANVKFGVIMRGKVTMVATACTPPAAGACDDNNVCTVDSYDTTAVGGICPCINTNNTVSCDDGEFCNGTDTCAGGSCVSSGDPCSAGGACNESTDMCDTCLTDGDCDDSNVCTTDACVGNTCENTAIPGCCIDAADCDDNDACTADICRPTNTCRNRALPIIGCCNTVADCVDDGQACTDDGCIDNICSYPSNCVEPEFCDPTGGCAIPTLTPGPVAGRFLVEEGSYFCMGNAYPQGTCVALSGGSDLGIVLGQQQPMSLTPSVCANGNGGTNYKFDSCIGSPGSITAPFSFFGVSTYISTNPVSWQSCIAHDGPSAEASTDLGNGCMAMQADIGGWEVFWNGSVFQQGPRLLPGVNVFALGQLCSDDSYELDWPAKIVGGPFNGVTGHWRLRGHVSTCHETVCDDNNPCTNDSFDLATCSCVFADTVVCDDGNECTDDTCDPLACGGCVYTPNTVSSCTPDLCHTGTTCSGGECGTVTDCDDNNACTADSCNPVTGACKNQNRTVQLCGDGNNCTTDSCDPATGNCSYVNNTVACQAANRCMLGDACSGGVCVEGTTPKTYPPANPLDDGNPCTDDSCNPANGQKMYTANSASCTPSDPLCFSGTTCADKVCGTPIDCSDNDTCTTDTCAAGVCTNDPKGDGAACDDNDACIVGDTCSGGACGGAYERNCNDWDACTDDSCDPVAGCVNVAANCDDGNSCTDDSCDSESGCVYTNNTVSCDDNDACTTSDTCSNGACGGATISCDDGDACTVDSCDAVTGCGNAAISCDDGNPCTDDTCNAVSGCVVTNNSLSCDDSDKCTTGDVCAGGSCTSGTPTLADCDDSDKCTTDSCSANACSNTPTLADCDDSDKCTADSCTANACSNTATLADCDDSDQCTTDSCSANACTNTAVVPPACNDSNSCTDDSCAADACSNTDNGSCVVKGDLDSDGDVDVNDALKALRIAAGIDPETAGNLASGDVAPLVNGAPAPDGTINIGDVVVILRKAIDPLSW